MKQPKLVFAVAAFYFASVVSDLVGQAVPKKLLGSAVFVQQKNGSAASGFMVCHAVDEKLCKVYLITNRHAIPATGKAASIQVRVTSETPIGREIKNLTIPVVGGDGNYLSTVRVNPQFDVVAIKITDALVKNSVQCCFIDTVGFATHDIITKAGLSLGDEIFLLGYPDAIFEERNTSPILRQGVIATDPKEDFSVNVRLQRQYGLPATIPGYLIDANVFPGSSGSMVILKPQAMTIEDNGIVGVASVARQQFYILGIVFASIPIDDVALHPKNSKSGFALQRMGLGMVLSTDTILNTLKLFDSN